MEPANTLRLMPHDADAERARGPADLGGAGERLAELLEGGGPAGGEVTRQVADELAGDGPTSDDEDAA